LFTFSAFVSVYALEVPDKCPPVPLLAKKAFVPVAPNILFPKSTPVLPVVILVLENTGVLKNF
jgi:hypothetical protein